MTGRWLLDPVLIGGLVTLALVYALLTGPLRHRLAPGTPYPRRKARFFYAAILALYLTEGSPLHDFAEVYSFSAHMLQHMLLSYLAPSLMLRGLPDWVLRPLLLHPRVKPVAKVLTHPVVAFSVFSLFFSLWHIPVIYEGALRNPALHHLEHVLFFIAALMLWWPLLSPLPELPRLSYAGALVYLFVLPIAQLPVFAAVTFADHAIYPTYASVPHHPFGDAHADQVFGGALMKVGGLFTFGLPFILTFFAWYRQDNPSHYRRRASTP
ncbi:cytochrome c oxidase assembly protein [Truepera radiovictrix]|uniref:Cytochrome c oxidase caa3-type, assembly factor CtaG-related protein n=1 Tax=Truepera radiovictrix (strain DSM 17093 / CIP 108686 / LMG 22925 / RQ-24) TaxID=649638 RepID=D7CV80_TRURR|nr:cytochrome c oxidase assembly protein [Truepera radiovictrix]ADI15907.1 Cytochrome c oxidase caa3-type, assembly factor CtaG-related protein [Truepera radiovictrix DSM 17093]WMT58466.1 cytochrome c oxidase assembly protein [Truepera radiovictrix]